MHQADNAVAATVARIAAATQAMNQPKTPALFWLRIVEPRVGRKNPVARDYIVLANDGDDAIAVFDAEHGAHQREGASTFVKPWDGKIARISA